MESVIQSIAGITIRPGVAQSDKEERIEAFVKKRT